MSIFNIGSKNKLIDELHTSIFIGYAQHEKNGKIHETPLALHPSAGSMREIGNTLVLGPPGSGKTSIIRNNLMNWQHSAIVIDLKGQLYEQTALRRYDLGNVYVLDVRAGTGHRYNPVAHTDKSQWRDLIYTFVSEQTKEPFWINCSVDMWMCLFHAAERSGKAHIPYGTQILSLGIGEAMQYLISNYKDCDECMRYLASFSGRKPDEKWIKDIDEKASKLLENKWASVVNTASLLDDSNLLNIFGGDDIDIESLFYEDGISTIYVQADETKPQIFKIFSQLIIKSLGDSLIKEGDKDHKKRPILFLLDEFGVIKLNAFKQWLDTMRSRDIILVLFAQEYDHLSLEGNKFDEDSINSIHHQILFKPVDPSGRIAKKISALSGMQSHEVTQESESSSESGKSYSTSRSHKERNIIEQEEIELWAMNQAYSVITADRTIKSVTRIPRMQDEAPEDWSCESVKPLPKLAAPGTLLEIKKINLLPPKKQLSAAKKAAKEAEMTTEERDRAQRLAKLGMEPPAEPPVDELEQKLDNLRKIMLPMAQ